MSAAAAMFIVFVLKEKKAFIDLIDSISFLYTGALYVRILGIYQQDKIYLLDFHLEHNMAVADVFTFFVSHQS